jgi:hypothetical protein
LAKDYFKEYFETAKTNKQIQNANTKAFMNYRKIITNLNKIIDTVQIKMCENNWSNINHNKTPSVALFKNKRAFMNASKHRGVINTYDRIQCAENFQNYVNSKLQSGENLKGTCVGLVDYVKNSHSIVNSFNYEKNRLEIDILNSQFADFIKGIGNLENIIAMVDQSGSMYSDNAGYAALGLGIIVATKSTLGKRVMTFSEEPSWISLEKCNTLYQTMEELNKHSYKSGLNTDFYKALKLLLDSCVTSNLPDSIVSNMVLAIFSDMQIDFGDSNVQPLSSMYDNIKKMYKDAGYSSVPHILFWNLRSTTGFPSLSENPVGLLGSFKTDKPSGVVFPVVWFAV